MIVMSLSFTLAFLSVLFDDCQLPKSSKCLRKDMNYEYAVMVE